MHLCPLNFTNRIAYNLLDALLLCADTVEPKINYHVPSVGFDSKAEITRREEMLKKWMVIIKSNDDLRLDRTLAPPFYSPRKVARIPK